MKTLAKSMRRVTNWLAVLPAIALIATPASAQWTKVPATKIPRTADGKPDLSAPAPRSPDGRPDLTGTWSPNAMAVASDITPEMKPGTVPLQPPAKALYEERNDAYHSRDYPDANSLPQAGPKIHSVASPHQLIRSPD